MENSVNYTPLRQWIADKQIATMSGTFGRSKENNVPFLSFTTKSGEKGALFTSKSLGEEIAEGTTLRDLRPSTLTVAEYVNAEGEQRIKLTRGKVLQLRVEDLGWDE